MKTSELNTVIGAGIVALVGGYLVWSARQISRLNNIYENLAYDLSEGIDVKVPEETVNQAIEYAVSRAVAEEVKHASNQIALTTRNDLRMSIESTVDKARDYIKQSVTEETRRKVSQIDIDDLREDIKEEAKEKILKKFDGDLDNLLEDFNANLKNVSKIYKSISDTIAK